MGPHRPRYKEWERGRGTTLSHIPTDLGFARGRREAPPASFLLHHDDRIRHRRHWTVPVEARGLPLPTSTTVAAGSATRRPRAPLRHRRHGLRLLYTTRRRWSALSHPLSVSHSCISSREELVMYSCIYVKNKLLMPDPCTEHDLV